MPTSISHRRWKCLRGKLNVAPAGPEAVANEVDSVAVGVDIRTVVVAAEEDSNSMADISNTVAISNSNNKEASVKGEAAGVTVREAKVVTNNIREVEVTSKAAVEAVYKEDGLNHKKTTIKATAAILAVADTVPVPVEDTLAAISTATALAVRIIAAAEVAVQATEETSNTIEVVPAVVATIITVIVVTTMITTVGAAEAVVAEVAEVAGPTTTAGVVARWKFKHEE